MSTPIHPGPAASIASIHIWHNATTNSTMAGDRRRQPRGNVAPTESTAPSTLESAVPDSR
jgi:hypothetical protein